MIVINYYRIISFFVAFILFKPSSFSIIMPSVKIICDIFSVFIFLICGAVCLYKKKVSTITILIIFYRVILMVSTLINQGDIIGVIKGSIDIITLSCIFDMYEKNQLKNILIGMQALLELYIYINFITLIIYPEGIYTTRFLANYFLGYDNVHIIYFVPALSIAYINSNINNSLYKKRFNLLLIIINLSIIMRWTATNLVMILAYDLFYLLDNSYIVRKILNIVYYVSFYILSFFSIIVFRIQDYFQYFIIGVLKKDLSFTGRTAIWDKNIEYIKENAFFGYGMEQESLRLIKNDGFSHAHNQILEILYQGGFLLLIFYILIIATSSQSLLKYKDYKVSKHLAFFMFLIFISMLLEVFRVDLLWIVFILSYHVNKFI